MPDLHEDETPDPHREYLERGREYGPDDAAEEAHAPPRPITVGDRPGPLPSELLESCDGGRGIAAFVLTPETLDRLPILTRWPVGSDGYLDDAEQWGTDEELVAYARSAGHGVVPTREVLALLRLDRILGNEHALSATGTGRLRGVVSRALRDWHARQRAIAEQLGPADPTGGPFPVADALLGQRPDPAAGTPTSIDHGDRFAPSRQHPVALRVYGPGLVEYDGRQLRIEYDTDLPDWPSRAIAEYERRDGELRQQLGNEQSKRITAEADLARHRAEWEQRSQEGREQVERLVESLRVERENVANRTRERDEARAEVIRLGRALESEESLVRDLDGLQPREETSPHPIAEDPRRPRLDHFPDDAILLTYRELRQLVGLHLEACASAVAPADSARAMRDGETGLRLAEVLDR